MTAERTGEPDVPQGTIAHEDAEVTALKATIRDVLERNDGLCMDKPEEREQLGQALTAALSPCIQRPSEPAEPDTEAAT